MMIMMIIMTTRDGHSCFLAIIVLQESQEKTSTKSLLLISELHPWSSQDNHEGPVCARLVQEKT